MAQPDILLVPRSGWPPKSLSDLESPSFVAILECKLSFTEQAEDQLEGLYMPLINHLFPQATITTCQVFHNTAPSVESDITSLQDLAAHLETGGPRKWHYP